MKTLVWIVVAIVLIGGGYWYVQQGGISEDAASDLGSYAYLCEGGVEFSMAPSSDVSSIRLTPGANASFAAATLAKTESTAGARFEGGGVVFIGAGEGVRLTVNNTTLTCNPVPSTESPPWNWGDAGEGGGVKQDVALIVSESIVGKWQSTDDAKFVREFKSDFTAQDWYEGKKVSSGLWVAFTKLTAPEILFPLEEDAVYVQMTMQGTQADTLNFKLTKLTPEELELIYMDRGGVLKFRSIK